MARPQGNVTEITSENANGCEAKEKKVHTKNDSIQFWVSKKLS